MMNMTFLKKYCFKNVGKRSELDVHFNNRDPTGLVGLSGIHGTPWTCRVGFVEAASLEFAAISIQGSFSDPNPVRPHLKLIDPRNRIYPWCWAVAHTTVSLKRNYTERFAFHRITLHYVRETCTPIDLSSKAPDRRHRPIPRPMSRVLSLSTR